MDTQWELRTKGQTQVHKRLHSRNVGFGSALILSFHEFDNGVHVVLLENKAKIYSFWILRLQKWHLLFFPWKDKYWYNHLAFFLNSFCCPCLLPHGSSTCSIWCFWETRTYLGTLIWNFGKTIIWLVLFCLILISLGLLAVIQEFRQQVIGDEI